MAGIKAPKVKTPAQMKMEMAVDRARNVLPQAEREANKAKMLEESAIKDRLYHGTTSDVNEFDPSKARSKTGNINAVLGTFMSDNPAEASRFASEWGTTGGNVMPVYASLKNPYNASYKEMDDLAMGVYRRMIQDPSYDPNRSYRGFDKEGQKRTFEMLEKHEPGALQDAIDFKNKLIEAGHDGIIWNLNGNKEVIAFEPTQIKSAIGNQGTYNPANPDITKAHGGAVHMQDGGDPQAEIDRMRYELSSRIKPTTDAEEQIKNARLMASPERTSLDAGDALTSPEMYEKNRDLFGVNRKTASQAYTEFGVPMIDASGKSVPFPKTMYDIESDKIEKQLESGIKPDWMSGKDFIQDQAARKGYVTSPKTAGDFGQNAMAALMDSKFLGGTLRALGAVDEAAQGVIGSSYGLDPTIGIIGQTGRLHRVPRGLSTIKEGIARDVGQFSNDVFNAQRGINQGYPTLGSEFSKAFVTPKPTTYEILSGLEPSMLPSSAAKIFAGSKSKTADIAMRDIAQARLIAGEDPAIVWKETGWTAPPYGGEMRYEIPDTGLSGQKITEAVSKKFNAFGKNKVDLRAAYDIKLGLERGNTMDEILAKLPAPPTEDALKIAMDDKITVSQIASRFNTLAKKPIETAMKTTGKLGSMVEHPEFFAAYPDMENLIRFETLGKKDIKNFRGSFNPYKTELKVSPHLESSRDSVLAHELQHAVQHREGTSLGGSPSGVKNSPQQFDPVTASELQMLQDRIINDTGRLGELHRRREAGTLTALERGELNSLTQALPEHANYTQARKDFLSQGTPQELYKRLAGEAEARLTQYRLGLTPEQRLEQYPYDPAYFKTATGYSIDDIINNIVREGSSISSKSIEPSIPKMKAEPRERVLAPANPQGFYSATEAAALNLQRKSGSGQAFLNDLLKQENVRPDEISAMGLDTFLKDKKNITAAEVQDFIANNKIQLGEKTYGTPPKLTPEQKTRLSDLQRTDFNKMSPQEFDAINGAGSYEELLRLQNARDGFDAERLQYEASRMAREARKYQTLGNINGDKLASQYRYKADHLLRRADLAAAEIAQPKYKQYALPGGENYREVVITLPPTNKYRVEPIEGTSRWKVVDENGELYKSYYDKGDATRAAASYNRDAGSYKSSHWNEPNPLAHLRMSDRVTDGKKTLLVDEVQSDWHQAAREARTLEIKRLVDSGMPKEEAQSRVPENFGYKGGTVERAKDYRWDKSAQETLGIKENDPAWVAKDRSGNVVGHYTSEDAAKTRLAESTGGVPDAPFKEDWYQLALKRAVKEAIDGGYDRVALPTGARVSERFDLSKQIDRIDYNKNDDGTYNLSAIKDGREVFAKEDLDEKELSGIIGKDVAKKIVGDEGSSAPKADRWEAEDGDVPEFKSLSGLDLSVGGEGMRKYYDEIYPGYLKKFGKKYGANVGKTTVDVDGVAEPLHYMEITPAMREEFKAGIHMKRGGKVSFANNIDAMRLALSKG